MALSGVRISWVMLARKALLSRPESSARAVSMRSCFWVSMKFVMLRDSPKYSVSLSVLVEDGDAETAYHVGLVIEWRMVEGQDDIIGFALLHGTLDGSHGLLACLGTDGLHILLDGLAEFCVFPASVSC